MRHKLHLIHCLLFMERNEVVTGYILSKKIVLVGCTGDLRITKKGNDHAWLW